MMIDYKENLINENSELNLYDPITKLMKYRMLSNEEMIDRDRCESAYRAYKKLNWLNDNNKDLELDTFFSSPYYYIKEMCRKYDIENNDNYYVSDFKRFVISEKDEDYLNMDNNRAQYLRKEWFCLKSTKEHYQKIFTNEDVLFYVESAHKIGAFHIIPKRFGYLPKCKWLLDDGIRALMVIEDNWISIKKSYGNISFEEYKRKFMLEELRKISRLKVYDTDTNFVLIKLDDDEANSLKLELFEKYNILIRDASNFIGLDKSYIRVAIKSHNDNKVLIESLRKILV